MYTLVLFVIHKFSKRKINLCDQNKINHLMFKSLNHIRMIFKPPYNGLYFIFLKFYGPKENDENLN